VAALDLLPTISRNGNQTAPETSPGAHAPGQGIVIQMGMNVDPEIDAERFRQVLGQLPTGVTVVTGHHSGGPVGMSANSVTSVSLDPPLILFCPAKSSTSWPKIRASGRFCVSVFSAHHEETSRRFAARGVDRFAGVSWHPRPSGPALDDAVAWIECTIDAEHEAGDHVIVVGAVDQLEMHKAAADPLVFFRGRYGSFTTRD
jgi:3-hydroxy-9,10-secoandrosta-1,3,5(10)-triene-9,17-dione monooxygenase reductase component